MADWRTMKKPATPLRDVLAEARAAYADRSEDDLARMTEEAVQAVSDKKGTTSKRGGSSLGCLEEA
jgi:hypothetical protein